VGVTIVPLFTLLVVLRIPVIELWLEYGAFTSVDTRAVGSVFLCLAPSFLMEAMAPIAFHIFFSLRDTRVLGVLAVIVTGEVLSNIVLDLILVRPFGLIGIGLATTLVKLPSTLIGWMYLGHCLGGLRLRALAPDVMKIVAASACMIPVVLLVKGYLGGVLGSTAFDRFLRVAILFGVGPSAYILLCLLFRVREVADLGRAVWGKVRGQGASAR
jgi:putative peptidoglycan lipid II flippase